jgi:hypothetical protein
MNLTLLAIFSGRGKNWSFVLKMQEQIHEV